MIYEKFCDYMYYLLLSPLKKVKKPFNQWYLLFMVLGRRMDDAKDMIYKASMQTMAAACEEELLPVFAKERKLTRYEGESVEDFRKRIVNCAEIYKCGGTDAGIVKTVRSLGYDNVEVAKAKDLTGDIKRWAEFYVIIKINVTSGQHLKLSALQNSVRDIKQAGAKDNYLFVYDAGHPEGGANDNRIDTCMVVCIIVENVPGLDAAVVVLTEVNGTIKADTKVLTNVWHLDGTYKLDGSMRLNAEVEEYRWGQ